MEKFLARTGSKHKICSPGSARLEKYRLRLGPARRKTGSTQPYGLCMLTSISKTVQGKIFILMSLHAQIAHLHKSTIEMSCSIILLRSSLQ